MKWIKGVCHKCKGMAVFNRMDGHPAFCPMCGVDTNNNWEQRVESSLAVLRVQNDNPERVVDFCVGAREYSLKPNTSVTVPINDGDRMYFDALNPHVPEVK